jgi:hypothetical protein
MKIFIDGHYLDVITALRGKQKGGRVSDYQVIIHDTRFGNDGYSIRELSYWNEHSQCALPWGNDEVKRISDIASQLPIGIPFNHRNSSWVVAPMNDEFKLQLDAYNAAMAYHHEEKLNPTVENVDWSIAENLTETEKKIKKGFYKTLDN